jgi:hypothetical protein
MAGGSMRTRAYFFFFAAVFFFAAGFFPLMAVGTPDVRAVPLLNERR